MARKWITAREAAALLGYHPATFVRKFCSREEPALKFKDNGKDGHRRRKVMVLLSEVVFLSGKKSAKR